MWICVRSKDAQKQLARTSLNEHGESRLFSGICYLFALHLPCLIPCHRCEKFARECRTSHHLITQLDVRGFALISVVRMAQFARKIKKLSHIIRARRFQDLRSPSLIIAPGGILFGTAAVIIFCSIILHFCHQSKITFRRDAIFLSRKCNNNIGKLD